MDKLVCGLVLFWCFLFFQVYGSRCRGSGGCFWTLQEKILPQRWTPVPSGGRGPEGVSSCQSTNVAGRLVNGGTAVNGRL